MTKYIINRFPINSDNFQIIDVDSEAIYSKLPSDFLDNYKINRVSSTVSDGHLVVVIAAEEKTKTNWIIADV